MLPGLLGLLAVGQPSAEPAEEPAEGRTVVAVREGVVTLSLTAEQVEHLALRLDPVGEAALPQAPPARARVVDLTPLLELRQRMRNTQAALASAERRAQAARQHLARLDALALAGAAIPADERRGAETARDGALADLEALRLEMSGLQESAGYQWGVRLSAEARAEKSELLDQLASHRRCLLLVAPRPAASWQTMPAVVRLDLPDPSEQSATGVVIDEAPASLAGQGKTWWVVTAASGLRAGMALEVVPQDGPMLRGGRLADSALVWHAGHRWYYLEIGEHRFERREAGEPRALGPGLWLVVGMKPGVRVVSVGAQSLLAEELRWSIPTEDDD